MTDAHNPDTNPHWTPLVARRLYACTVCNAEHEVQTNHTGTVWSERCSGTCRTILHPHTEHEKVLPGYTSHRYVAEV